MNEISPVAAAEVQLVCQCHNYAADGFCLLAHMFLKGVTQWKQCREAVLPQRRGLALWDEGSLVLQVVENGKKRYGDFRVALT